MTAEPTPVSPSAESRVGFDHKLHLINVVRVWHQRAVEHAENGRSEKSRQATVKLEEALNLLTIKD